MFLSLHHARRQMRVKCRFDSSSPTKVFAPNPFFVLRQILPDVFSERLSFGQSYRVPGNPPKIYQYPSH